MRLFLLSLVLLSASAHAANNDLKDSRILGLYELQPPNSKSDLQKAELIYNTDNALVVVVDRNDQEYELSAPNAQGVIFEGEDEPNCGGEETKCWYDSHTEIKLQMVNVGGQEIPQLKIKITQSNAWDDKGEDDTTITYVLNWTQPLDYAIPYYVNIANPPDLVRLASQCQAAMRDIEYEDGAGYLIYNDICPHAYSVQLREPFAKSLDYYLKELLPRKANRGFKEVTAAQLRTQVFEGARALARKYQPNDQGSPSRADVLEQIAKIEQYATQSELVYVYVNGDDAMMVLVDPKRKTASSFDIKVKK